MRHPALPRLLSVVGYLLAPVPALAVDTAELDQYEERTLARCTERAVRAAKSDRVLWVKALEDQFPGKCGNPLKEDEYGAWFDLVVGKGTEWRKDATDNALISALFDKVLQRMELGPVPSIKREEFMKYAKRVLVPAGQPSSEQNPDPNEEADKVFRALDRDGDGILSAEELTTKLKEDRQRFDADANGRIDKDEYRTYFQKRVATAVEAAGKADDKDKDKNGRKDDPKAGKGGAAKGGGFPDWLAELDLDKDGQISLHEWRRGGREISAFTAMDLDGDGLLTKDEFLRYAKMKEKEKQDPDPPQ